MRQFIVAALLCSVAAGPAWAEPSKEAKAFGAREFIQDISLSPDGTKVAMIQPDGTRGGVLVVADLASAAMNPITHVTGDPERLDYCRWSTNVRLVCRLSIFSNATGQKLGFTRLIALDIDGKNMKMLTQSASSRALTVQQDGGDVIDWSGDGTGGSILMAHSYVPDNTIGTRLANNREGVGVDLVDTLKVTRRPVEQPKLNAVEYVSDGAGAIRIMGIMGDGAGDYMGDRITYNYRKRGARDWRNLDTFQFGVATGKGFSPQAVDPALDAVYGFDDANGHRVLARIALDGSLKKEIVVEQPNADVDGIIRIGRQQRVVGATWAGETRTFKFFDAELEQLSRSLGKALPKQPQVRFVDASIDEKHLLLQAGSDDNPGVYYLYDKATKKLEEIFPARPQVADIKLSKMTPVSYRAADGTMIPAYLTIPAGSSGKGLPTIVMPHGGPSSRDEWGFDWLPQFFASRGFAVLQPNFRGSSGYGEAWFQKNGFQSWRTAVGDINDGGKWLLSQGIAAPGKIAIFGWSYGGYAALQSAALDADLFKAIVAVAPVTDLETLRSESLYYTNFPIVDRFIGSGPHVREGSPANHAAEIKAPVLLFHGDRDMNVGVGESRLMAGKLRSAGKQVQYVEFKDLDHQLDDSAARTEMLDKSDAFLRSALGM